MRHVKPPCNCFSCYEAGVTDRDLVQVPADDTHDKPYWLHGEDLKRWYEKRDAFFAKLQGVGVKTLAPVSRGVFDNGARVR